MMIGLASVSLIPSFPGFGAVGFAAGIAITLAAIIIALIFYILAASHLKKALNILHKNQANTHLKKQQPSSG
jgi:uncharacterized membrane protein